MAPAVGASAVASADPTSSQGVTTTGTVDVSAKGTADLPAVSGDTPSLQPAAKTGTVALPTQGTPELPASGIADVPVVPIQPSTLLGNLGTGADFSQGGASLGQDPAGGAFSGTLDRDGAGIPHAPAGGSLAADLTNIGRLGEMTIVGDSRAGISIQPQPANVGTAFSSLDQGVKQPDALNPDMWRHA
jgi:hypothetical protein